MSAKVAEHIGNFVGFFVEADQNNFNGGGRDFMRVRVSIDIRKSLKQRMKIQKEGEASTWVTFKYERLPSFCFFCGVIGHSDRLCELFLDFPDKNVQKAFGVWLRAPARRSQVGTGNKWLLPGPPAMSSVAGGNHGHSMYVNKESTGITEFGSSSITKNQGRFAEHGNIYHGNNSNLIGERNKSSLTNNNVPTGGVDGAGASNLSSTNETTILNGSGTLNGLGKNIGPVTVLGPKQSAGLDTLVIIDPKRRRMEEEGDKLAQQNETLDIEDPIILAGSKNLVEAEPVIQARRSL